MAKQEFRIKQHQLYISNFKTWMKLLSEKTNVDENNPGLCIKISLASLATQPAQALESALYKKK